MTTLNELDAGSSARVIEIDAEPSVKERLKMLGIDCGAQVRMLKKSRFGAFLIESAFGKVGMGRNPAAKIFVSEVEKA